MSYNEFNYLKYEEERKNISKNRKYYCHQRNNLQYNKVYIDILMLERIGFIH